MSKFIKLTGGRFDFKRDTFTAQDGCCFDIIFFNHASLAISTDDYIIYVDPVMMFAPYAELPKADIIAITHSHSDHLDVQAVEALMEPSTQIICCKSSAEILAREVLMVAHGSQLSPINGLRVEGVAAYNTSPSKLQFHPASREDCGFIFTIGGNRIYVAGDTEPTPEMLALQGLDIVMLPVNQPYTMTEDQAVSAIKSLRPRVFYPYHTGQVEHVTDVEQIKRELEGVCEVRLRGME
ncbi:MAG: MBL fold metallo-hydrolase [Rikenellaceae bacterium]